MGRQRRDIGRSENADEFAIIAGLGDQAARLLCVVGMLRAIDCLYLPLLDGIGLAGRNMTVALVAAVVLTAGDIGMAALLGPELGILAVVIGRIIGYPLVISLHASIALGQLRLSVVRYARDLFGLILCGALAVVPGALLVWLAPGLAPAVRLPLVAVLSLGTVAVLLSVLQDLGPRAMIRALRGGK